MTELRSLYYCKHCHNLVEIVQDGKEALVCCGEPMTKLVPNTTDAANEKHVPVIQETEKGILVTIGSIEHPMTEEHHIQFIEVITEQLVIRHELKPGMKPQAEFYVKRSEVVEVREFCNLHMLWSTK